MHPSVVINETLFQFMPARFNSRNINLHMVHFPFLFKLLFVFIFAS